MYKKLSDIKIGTKVIIRSFENDELFIKLMEMGLIQGEKIDVVSHKLGLWIINTLSDNDNVTSTIALREEEFDRICLL